MVKRGLAAALVMAMMLGMAGCSNTAPKAAEASKDNGGQTQTNASWPKNVEIIVPASAGGDTDFNARLLAQKLSEKLPANFVVSNVNGNGGATGTR